MAESTAGKFSVPVLICFLGFLAGGCGPNIKSADHPWAQSRYVTGGTNSPPPVALRPSQPDRGQAPPKTPDSVPTPSGGKRVALVIGNSDYPEIGALENPRRDAEAVAERLRRGGFTLLDPVRKGRDVQADLNRDEMREAHAALEKAAQDAEIAMLYYAGHGLQLDGLPYLVPVDLSKAEAQNLSTPAGRSAVERRLVKLDDFIEGLDLRAELAVSVFDACREIPVLNTRSLLAGGMNYRGLGHPRSLGRHRVLAFSAGFGELAEDGTGGHSPYTQAFLDEFDRDSTQEITRFFRRVAERMTERTGQQPEILIQGSVPDIAWSRPGF